MEATEIHDNDVQKYLDQLSEQERLVLEIARSHLGSSFDIRKSIGFLTWKRNIMCN